MSAPETIHIPAKQQLRCRAEIWRHSGHYAERIVSPDCDLQLVYARGRKYLAADERRRFLEVAARAP